MPIVPIRMLRMYTNKAFTHTGTHLRGSVIRQFPDRVLLHNHREGGAVKLPDVRFLVREGVPHIIAIGNGRDEVLDVYRSMKEIRVPGGSYDIVSSELLDEPIDLGVRPQLFRYQSSTHWLGLNQANFREYKRSTSRDERRMLLQRVLVGNFLMALRQLGIELSKDERILVSIEDWNDRFVEVRGNKFLGLLIRVTSNMAWSPWLGVGKQVAKGFGQLVSAEHPQG